MAGERERETKTMRETQTERERRDERYSVNFVVFALDVGGREKSGRCCRRRRMGEEAS
jgi:hypothetical protein